MILSILKAFGLPLLMQAVIELLASTVKNPTSPEALKLRTYVELLKTTVDGFLEKTRPGGNLP